ncbi:hypothetical protein PR048_032742 [Dryococelus australis]|uniref:Uncharacterized protein n=1 Tax=Dryococelus australis TaxID=614101 RepID=A0ABQ9G332_9NEOP|nr:hypothetical protein PR048_032742 [Dryococelus australis]
MPLAGGFSWGTPVPPPPCAPALLHPRVSLHVMFRDDGHLRAPAGKSVARRVSPRPGFTPQMHLFIITPPPAPKLQNRHARCFAVLTQRNIFFDHLAIEQRKVCCARVMVAAQQIDGTRGVVERVYRDMIRRYNECNDVVGRHIEPLFLMDLYQMKDRDIEAPWRGKGHDRNVTFSNSLWTVWCKIATSAAETGFTKMDPLSLLNIEALSFGMIYHALREHYTPVHSPARRGDGALVARASVTLIAPALVGPKRRTTDGKTARRLGALREEAMRVLMAHVSDAPSAPTLLGIRNEKFVQPGGHLKGPTVLSESSVSANELHGDGTVPAVRGRSASPEEWALKGSGRSDSMHRPLGNGARLSAHSNARADIPPEGGAGVVFKGWLPRRGATYHPSRGWPSHPSRLLELIAILFPYRATTSSSAPSGSRGCFKHPLHCCRVGAVVPCLSGLCDFGCTVTQATTTYAPGAELSCWTSHHPEHSPETHRLLQPETAFGDIEVGTIYQSASSSAYNAQTMGMTVLEATGSSDDLSCYGLWVLSTATAPSGKFLRLKSGVGSDLTDDLQEGESGMTSGSQTHCVFKSLDYHNRRKHLLRHKLTKYAVVITHLEKVHFSHFQVSPRERGLMRTWRDTCSRFVCSRRVSLPLPPPHTTPIDDVWWSRKTTKL